MDQLFQKFYETIYLRTNGYIPIYPLQMNVHPGDFFQIRNGEFVTLGNVFNPPIVDQLKVEFDSELPLNPVNWEFNSGVSKPYSGRSTGSNAVDGEFEFSKQIISFQEKGSFLFKGENPSEVRIGNWADLKDELIIKMTQTYYSFREVYIITECVILDSHTLAISGADNGELEIATEAESFGLVNVFGNEKAKTIQSKNIDYYNREGKRKSSFFKAKKLIVSDNKVDVFISEFLRKSSEREAWAHSFYPYDFYQDEGLFTNVNSSNFRISVLDLLQGNQLNPNTALDYFEWSNMSLDDVSKLFLVYGNE